MAAREIVIFCLGMFFGNNCNAEPPKPPPCVHHCRRPRKSMENKQRQSASPTPPVIDERRMCPSTVLVGEDLQRTDCRGNTIVIPNCVKCGSEPKTQ